MYLTEGERPLYHLSAALARGDVEDATYWLGRVAMGRRDWEVEVDLGRFSPEARRAA